MSDDNEEITPEAAPKGQKRANYLPSIQFFQLDQACLFVSKAFDSQPYLVGSSLVKRDYRDVDVRLILEDSRYDKMFVNHEGEYLNAYWSLLCTSISMYLSQASGLPVDFQIQRMTQANEKHHGSRNALGIFVNYPGERPSDNKPVTL
jgi:hypothetical protein